MVNGMFSVRTTFTSTGKIGKFFKLTKVSGAYWRRFKQQMLQRFMVQAGLHKRFRRLFKRIQEAEKRDHRKLGKLMDLFHFRRESRSSFLARKGRRFFKNLSHI